MKYDALKRKLKKIESLYPSSAPLTTTLQSTRLAINDLEQSIEEKNNKIKEYETVMNWILKNFDFEYSGLSDSEYHAKMLELVKAALGQDQ